MTFAIWRTPNCPLGEWTLGVEPRPGVLHDLAHYHDRAEADRMLAKLQEKESRQGGAAAAQEGFILP